MKFEIKLHADLSSKKHVLDRTCAFGTSILAVSLARAAPNPSARFWVVFRSLSGHFRVADGSFLGWGRFQVVRGSFSGRSWVVFGSL